MKASTLFIAGIAALVLPVTASFSQQISRFEVTSLTAGMHVIHAEVASTDEEREQGLMFREKMAQNDGMLFVFPAPASVCMWMKNTILPLSVAFMDEDGKIINIEDMKPQTLDSHCGKKQVRYALEMNLGWFKQKNIKPGNTLEGLPHLR